MRDSLLPNRVLKACFACVAVFLALPAVASITTSPSSVTIAPGESTQSITLDASVAPGPSVANAAFSGLPSGASVEPPTVVLLFNISTGQASTTFSIVTSALTPPGAYPIVITTLPDYGAGAGIFTLVVAQPDFLAVVAPNTVPIAWGATGATHVTTTPLFGFAAAITYTVTGFPAGITTSGSQTVTSPYSPIDFQLSVAPRTPPGIHAGALVATWNAPGLQTRSIPLAVNVLPPTLAANFAPPSLTIAAAGAASNSTLVLTPGNGYAGSPLLNWNSLPPGLEVTPIAFPSPSLPPPQSIPVTVRATGASPGTYQLTAHAVDAGASVDSAATMVVTVTAPPDAAIAVSPPAISVSAGRSATVTVTATGINGFSGTLDVSAPNVASVTFTPAAFSLHAGEARQVLVQATSSATVGNAVATFSATSSSLAGTRSAILSLTIVPAAPEITSVTPPALTAGSLGVSMRLIGQNFQPGAAVTFTPLGPVAASTVVASPTLVNLVVDTPAGTTIGHYRIDLRNPDGQAAASGMPVLVVPASSLGAPLSVPTAAIVFPRPYAAVGPTEAVYPRAVLATTGVGTIIGTWRFDGAPFDQFVVTASGGYPIEVISKMPIPVATTGEHRLELVVEQPQQLTTEPVPVIMSVESNSGLRVLEPAAGEPIDRADASFRWTIVPGATGYEVEIEFAGESHSRRLRLSDSRWNPDERALETLRGGTHRFRVAAIFPGEVHGVPTQWREFVVSDSHLALTGARCARCVRESDAVPLLVSLHVAEATEPVSSGAEAAVELPRDWAVTLLGSATSTDEDVPSITEAARLQVTTSGDMQDSDYFTKWTGDLSARKDLDPEYDAASENRAWQLELGAAQSRSREELRAGYSPPEFLDQSEFLAAGLARGGILGKVATPLGAISLYDTFHDDAAGAVSVLDLKQRVSGAAWEAPDDTNRSLLRVFGLRSRGAGSDEEASTEAEAIGVLWRFVSSPALTVVVEGAHGTLEGALQPGFEDLDGSGLHLGASGTRGTLSWGVDFRDVDAGFVNPANLGLSVGGTPDRVGGDLSLAKSFGTSMLSLQLRGQQSGTLADGSGANVDERSGILTFVLQLGPRLVTSATGSATTTKGDGDTSAGLPESDRTMLSLGLTLSETFGGLSLAESLSWQELSDEVTSAFDSTVTSGSVTAGGMLGQSILLSALVSGTRSESPEPVGVTDLWLASLQPTFNWAKAGLAFTPRASYSRVESDLGGASESEQYQALVQWSPLFWSSLVNVQVGADWNRNSVEGMPSSAFDTRLVASLTLRWGLARDQLAATPPASLPSVPTASLARRSRPAS